MDLLDRVEVTCYVAKALLDKTTLKSHKKEDNKLVTRDVKRAVLLNTQYKYCRSINKTSL